MLVSGTVWTCSGAVARLSQQQTISSLRIHRTRLHWFVSEAEPALPGSRSESGRLHGGEGTFLSVVHCQQPSYSLATLRDAYLLSKERISNKGVDSTLERISSAMSFYCTGG